MRSGCAIRDAAQDTNMPSEMLHFFIFFLWYHIDHCSREVYCRN
jgi:hypothetical protein